MQKVSLDVTKAQRADIPVDESEGDATLSDVFTAVGDKLSFTVTFDDKMIIRQILLKSKIFLIISVQRLMLKMQTVLLSLRLNL